MFNLTNTAARNLSLRIMRNCARYCLANSRETYRLVGGTRTWRAHGAISSVSGWPRTPFLPFDSCASLSLGRMRTKHKPIQTADNEFSSTKRVSNNDLSVEKLTDRLFYFFYKRNWNIFWPIPTEFFTNVSKVNAFYLFFSIDPDWFEDKYIMWE